MQRVAFHATSWFAVGTAQLTSGAVGSVVPGGAATAGASAHGMLTKAGVRREDVAPGIAASTIASTAVVFAMPVLALPAIIGGVAAPDGLVQTLYVGIAGFVAVAVLAACTFGRDAPLRLVGRAAGWVIRRLKRDAAADLPERLLAQRNRMKETFGRRWLVALTGAVGKVGFDYLALVLCLARVTTRAIAGPARLCSGRAAGDDPGHPGRARVRRGGSHRHADRGRGRRAAGARRDARPTTPRRRTRSRSG
jgi:hypothetical protein